MMKPIHLFTLASGVGWILGTMISIGALYTNGLLTSYSFEEAMGNAIVLSFPGVLLFLIALILAVRTPIGNN